jgi:hypothetical protein
MSVQTPPELSYAPASGRWYTRRRGRRWIIGITLALVATYLAFHASELKEKAEGGWRLWQENHRIAQCMSYEPTGDVVWDSLSDAAKMKVLLAHDSEMVATTDADGSPAASRLYPEIFRRYGRKQEALVFLHERHLQNGERVLIGIEYCAARSGRRPHFAATVIIPGTLRRWPVGYGPFSIMEETPLLRAPKRIYAGEVDSSDPSSLTIRVDSAEGSHVLRATVRTAPEVLYPPYTVDMREIGSASPK